MAPQLTIDGRELELSSSAAPAPAAAPEPLFAFEAFAQLDGQRALELPELEPRSVPCPRCSAGIGSPCMRPSGHAAFGGAFHAPRVRDAERAACGLGPYNAPDPLPEPASEPESTASEPVRGRCSAADPEHRARMDAGRARAQLERDARAVERVERFRSWSRAGAPIASIPEIPSDADWRAAREARSSAA